MGRSDVIARQPAVSPAGCRIVSVARALQTPTPTGRKMERDAREALDEVVSHSRAAFLKKAVVGGGILLAGGVLISGLPQIAAAAPSPA